MSNFLHYSQQENSLATFNTMPQFFPAFALSVPVTLAQGRHGGATSPRRPRPTNPSTSSTSSPSNDLSIPLVPTRLQMARLRCHLIKLRHSPSVMSDDTSSNSEPSDSEIPINDSDLISPPSEPSRLYSLEERRARSERLRECWRDPAWRAAMMAKRRSPETQKLRSEAARRLWRDPDFRARMRSARLGRPAPNKGVSPSNVTRLRMSVARKGNTISEATKKKMSEAKLKRPEGDNWAKLISESKKGKTKEYFQMRREFRALHRDLKLWSDSYRSKYGRLPSSSTYDRFVAPMMVFRIKRYLVLRETFGNDEPETYGEIISR